MTYGLAQGRVATLRQTTAFVSLFDLSGLSASDRFGSWLCENAERAGGKSVFGAAGFGSLFLGILTE